MELNHCSSVSTPTDIDRLLIYVQVSAFLDEWQLNRLKLRTFKAIRTDRRRKDESIGKSVRYSRRLTFSFLFLGLWNRISRAFPKEGFCREVGNVFIIGTKSRNELDSFKMRQFRLSNMSSSLLIIENPLTITLDHLDYTCSWVT